MSCGDIAWFVSLHDNDTVADGKVGLASKLWQYGLWSFQTGGTKLESFLPLNQHAQRKLLNFEYWISGGLRSFQKSEF